MFFKPEQIDNDNGLKEGQKFAKKGKFDHKYRISRKILDQIWPKFFQLIRLIRGSTFFAENRF